MDCLGALSYLVRMPDGIMWRRHVDHLRKGGADDPIEQTEEPEPEAHSPTDASMPLSNPMQAESPVLPNSDDQEGFDQHELEDSSQEERTAPLDSDTLTTRYPIRNRRPPNQLYGTLTLLDHGHCHLGERSVMYAVRCYLNVLYVYVT